MTLQGLYCLVPDGQTSGASQKHLQSFSKYTLLDPPQRSRARSDGVEALAPDIIYLINFVKASLGILLWALD